KRVQRNRQRLGESGLVKRHPDTDREKVDHRQVDQFTKKTGMVRVAQKAKVRANVVVAAQTKLTVIAIKRRLKCPAVARNEPTNASPRLHDRSCRLMSEYHRINVRSAADPALAVSMKIGSADAYGLDADLHFAWSGIFNRHVSKPECLGSDEFRSLHGILFSQNKY